MMKSICFLLLTLFAFSCSGSKEISSITSEGSFKHKKAIVEMGFDTSTDPYHIVKAVVDETRLMIEVTYRGGCEEHVFELFTDGLLMKSLPPKQRFFLKHYAHAEGCEELIQENLVFELGETTTTGNTLIILLDQHDGEMIMEF